MGYTRNALAGFSWQTVLKIIVGLVTLAKISIVARILSPSDFGLFSLTTIALGISEATTQTGINYTIIQSKNSVAYFLDTAWVISIIRGLLIGSIMLVLAIALSKFFGQESLILLIGVTSLIPVIKGFINPSIISLRKNLHFFGDSMYQLSLTVAEAILAVILSLLLKSVFALVLSMIGAAIFEVVVSFVIFSQRPRFNYLKSRADVIFGNAKWLSFSALFSYLNENLDNLLIGKITSTFDLGLYHNSYALGHKTNYEFAKSASHGTMPILAKLLTQKERLRRAFFRSTGATMILVTLTSIPLFLFPQFFVTLLLGEQWLAVIPLVRWLVAAGLLHSFSAMTYNLFLAQRDYLPMNAHLLVSVIVMVILVLVLGNQFGLIGAVIAIFLSRLFTLPIICYGLYKLVKS